MVDGAGVAFALRAAVEAGRQNYYLIQIAGPGADEPFKLNGFIVKSGELQRIQSIPISRLALAETLKPGSTVEISLKMKDNNVNVYVTDNKTGKPFFLGPVTDSNRNFPIGAVGIAAIGDERNEVGFFTICKPECAK